MSSRLWAAGAAIVLFAGAAPAEVGAQVSDDAVRIGVLNDQSGVYADFGGRGSIVAAEMAVEDFGGTVLGKPVEIVSADHQNKPDIGANIARQWFDVDGVDMITELTTSSVALAVQEIGEQKNRITMVSGAATSSLTNEACSPVGFHWTYDTNALANGTGQAVVQEGGDTWFFLTADYAFGHALEADTSEIVEAMGGEVLGAVRHPLGTADFSSFLLQAQGSGAEVIGLANAGGDTTNSIKQAAQFGIVQGGQKLAGLLLVLSDIHALGLETAQGLALTTGFYWDYDDETRAWSERYFERMERMPNMIQAGVYSAVTHYLKAIEAAGTDEATAVAAKIKELPVDDMFVPNGGIVREDGRMVHDMFLAEVKTPDESTKPWDYFEIARTIPGTDAYPPLSESECPLVTG
ncbi:MAG TPA: ABC transporter substrate-binding protein [Alphaproteobacteria bacterium]|nr:ABC transporter substrate-binding protein [Alphaproteobacteria bacterium]